MSTKTEIQAQANKNAELVVNNSFIDSLSAQLKEKQQYGLSFPLDYNPTNALMGAYLLMKESVNKEGKNILESCTQTSIANSLMEMVTTGLDANKKQGYFIAYGGKCQFQKSYFGNITLARRYGMKEINASIIYEGDILKYHKEDGKTIIDVHEQDFMNIDNDKIVGAYAVAIMNDGERVAEIMNMAQLKKAWAQRQGGLKEDATSTHTKFKDQMAKKTVINRLCKMITNTFSNDGYVLESVENEEEHIDVVKENVAYDIVTKANSIPIEEIEESNEVIEKVEAEVVEEPDLPSFMTME